MKCFVSTGLHDIDCDDPLTSLLQTLYRVYLCRRQGGEKEAQEDIRMKGHEEGSG